MVSNCHVWLPEGIQKNWKRSGKVFPRYRWCVFPQWFSDVQQFHFFGGTLGVHSFFLNPGTNNQIDQVWSSHQAHIQNVFVLVNECKRGRSRRWLDLWTWRSWLFIWHFYSGDGSTPFKTYMNCPLVMTNSSPWYRWPIEIDALPWFTYDKWWFPWANC